MFHRYLVIITSTIAVLTCVILLTFPINTHAYCTGNLINFESPQEVTARLIKKTIDSYNSHLTEDQKSTICQTIINEATSNNIDPFLITGVIAAESSFIPNAVSPCAAQGLMQLTACVANMMNIEDPFDIKENIYAGTKYLKQLHQIFKDTDLTLAAYNAGPTRVARLGRIPRISETINYIGKVQRFYRNMQVQFKTAMLNLAAYPVCFKLKSTPVQRLLSSRDGDHNPSDGGNNSESVTAFFEIKRYLKFNKMVCKTVRQNNLPRIIVNT